MKRSALFRSVDRIRQETNRYHAQKLRSCPYIPYIFPDLRHHTEILPSSGGCLDFEGSEKAIDLLGVDHTSASCGCSTIFGCLRRELLNPVFKSLSDRARGWCKRISKQREQNSLSQIGSEGRSSVCKIVKRKAQQLKNCEERVNIGFQI